MPYTIIFLVVLAGLFLASAIRILNEYERGVIFRLGRVMDRAKGPGLIILIPVVDRIVKISLSFSEGYIYIPSFNHFFSFRCHIISPVSLSISVSCKG